MDKTASDTLISFKNAKDAALDVIEVAIKLTSVADDAITNDIAVDAAMSGVVEANIVMAETKGTINKVNTWLTNHWFHNGFLSSIF